MKINSLKIYLMILFFIFSCQHARIRFTEVKEIIPAECTQPVKNKKKCEEAKAKLEIERSGQAGKVEEMHQSYFFWGLKPANIDVDGNSICPSGVSEIYQYSTFRNALLEQLTFGIYSPRTMRVTCK